MMLKQKINYLLERINWGASTLDAEAIEIMDNLEKDIEKSKEEPAYRMEVKHEGSNKTWHEKLTGSLFDEKPTTDNEAVEQAKATIDFFNDSLRPNEKRRELVGVQKVGGILEVMNVLKPDE